MGARSLETIGRESLGHIRSIGLAQRNNSAETTCSKIGTSGAIRAIHRTATDARDSGDDSEQKRQPFALRKFAIVVHDRKRSRTWRPVERNARSARSNAEINPKRRSRFTSQSLADVDSSFANRRL